MKLTAFQYGTTRITGDMAFPQGDPQQEIPIALLFFLLETGGKRILIDTGCDTMPGFPLYTHRRPTEVLAQYGLSPKDITHVFLTHAHHDHMGAVSYYREAEIWLQAQEAQRVTLWPGARLSPFDSSLSLAENVTALHIGGHSRGSSIVLVDTPQTIFALCGDECYTRQNLLLGIPTGSSCCPEKSRRFVEEYRRACYTPIVFHDPELVGTTGYRVLYEDPEAIPGH